MQVVCTVPFKGCRDGEIHPEQIAEGDRLEGDLALVALEEGWAEEVEEEADHIVASNAARELAASHDLDLAAIEGTGREGGITVDDVRAAIKVTG